jgi:predicted  nucleic acid-binding Zn-ribbon protein
MSETEKQKKRRDNIRNLREINRILSRKLRDTQKYLSQQIKNIEVERDRYKKQVEELNRQLQTQNQKTIDTTD